MEDGPVLRGGDTQGGAIEGVEIDVAGAAVGVFQLGAGDRERGPQLDERRSTLLCAAVTPSPGPLVSGSTRPRLAAE